MSRNTVEKGNFGSDGAIKAVIFDCDGVIVDSRAANASLYNQFLIHFNKEPLNEGQLNYVHSHTLQESLKFLLGDESLIREAERLWQEMDYEPLIELLTLQPGLMECLELLRRHYKTAIATNRTRTMGQLLERFGLNPYFDLVVTSLDVHHPKPHPESVNKILSYLDITPDEACYIGDSDVDRETSERAGVLFIAYRNEELKAAHHVFHFDELIPILKQYSRM
jgi:phosphoglycolate phosphatase